MYKGEILIFWCNFYMNFINKIQHIHFFGEYLMEINNYQGIFYLNKLCKKMLKKIVNQNIIHIIITC